jgi:hypothetical protein
MSETFSTPRPNVFKSSAGFEVELVSRSQLRYRRDGRTLTISIEPLVGDPALIFRASSITHWDDPARVTITPAERARIIDDIRRAIRFRGFEIALYEPSWSG